MSLSFLTPLAGLVALAGVLALFAQRTARARSRAVATALRLPAPGARPARIDAALVVATAALLGLAAAQPIVSATVERQGLAESEIIVVVDVTRSMLARRAATEPTRLERARTIAKEFRAEFPDVRVGISSFTDRLLPHLFPTLSSNAFAATLDRAIDVERPPPDRRSARATALASLGGLARASFFREQSTRRVAVVLTDGESIPVDLAALGDRLERGRVSTAFVHLWRPDEALFDERGNPLDGYRPDRTAPRALSRVADAVRGSVFAEGETGELARAVRRLTGQGALSNQARELQTRQLAPWLVALALVPLSVLVARRLV